MPELLQMPEVAANTPSAVLASWSLPVDAGFRTHDTIATVETDKAVVDVEAESDGVLVAAPVAEGTEARIGAPIALLAGLGEQVADVDAVLATLGASSTSDNDTSHPTPTPTPTLELASVVRTPDRPTPTPTLELASAVRTPDLTTPTPTLELVSAVQTRDLTTPTPTPTLELERQRQVLSNSNSNVGVGHPALIIRNSKAAVETDEASKMLGRAAVAGPDEVAVALARRGR